MKHILHIILLVVSCSWSAFGQTPLPLRNPQFEAGTNEWRLTGGAFLAEAGQGLPVGGLASAGLNQVGSCWRQFNVPITNGVQYISPHVAQVIHVSPTMTNFTRTIFVDFVENYPGTNRASISYKVTNGIPRAIPLILNVGPCRSIAGDPSRGLGSYIVRGDCGLFDTW